MLGRFAWRRGALALVGAGSVALAVSCSAGSGGTGIGGGGGGSDTGGTSALGGSSGTTPIGGTSGVPAGGTGASTATGGGPNCAGDLVMGEPVPVDVYVMLDISGSMLTNTGSADQTKWAAVKGALNAFLNAPESAGLGVAIQYFPLMAPGVPPSCATSAECGEGGPCLMKACALYAAGFVQCEAEEDCASPLVKDDGPCETGFCRLSGAACADDTACQVRATNVGPCVGIGRCQNDASLTCLEPGTLCSAGNPCVEITSNLCVHETLCDASSYATPAVEFSALPGAAAAIATSMEAQAPRGETPSRPALRGAIDHARTWATMNPGHSVVVVLATDGLPTDCSNGNALHPSSAAEVDEVVAVAAEGLSASPNVSTFVVGVFAAADTAALGNLDRIAAAGGTDRAHMVDASGTMVDAQFLEALNSIRQARLACEFRIPEAPAGMELDFGFVNVVLSDAAMTQTTITRVRDGATRCDATGGWYYDVEPTTGTPTRIIACPSTCELLKSTVGGSVQIQLGCEQIVR